jgi:hypothetical protein
VVKDHGREARARGYGLGLAKQYCRQGPPFEQGWAQHATRISRDQTGPG